MPYSPVELRHVRIGRALFGYKREATDRLLDEVAGSFEGVWRERGELADEVEELSAQLSEIREREHLLASTLVTAEKAAAEAKAAAKREAELIVAEAHQEARSITRAAQAERERLFGEVRRIEALLRSALGVIEETARPAAEPAPDPEAEPVAAAGVQLEPAPPAAGQPAAPEAAPEVPEAPEPGPAAEDHGWPAKEDTREFPSLLHSMPDSDRGPGKGWEAE